MKAQASALEFKQTRLFSILFLFIFSTEQVLSFTYGLNSLKDTYCFDAINDSFLVEENRGVSLNVESEALPETKEARNSNTTLKSAGVGQADVSGFTINSTDGLVDKFTGDFSYSIPLGDVEGFPLTLTYNSNVAMNTEASWVGLGFNFNVGSVSRDMRGLPDEFNGDQTVERTFHQEPEKNGENYLGEGDAKKKGGFVAYSYGTDKKYTFTTSAQLTLLKGNYGNNYIGLGKTFDFSIGATAGMMNNENGLALSGALSFGFSSDSKRGIGINKAIGLSASHGDNFNGGGSVSLGNSFSSRGGLSSRFIGFSVEAGEYNVNSASASATAYIPYGTATMTPSVQLSGTGFSISNKQTFYGGVKFGSNTVRLGYIQSKYHNESSIVVNSEDKVIQPAFGYFHSGKRHKISYSETQKPLMDFNRSNDVDYSEEMKDLAFSFQTFDVFTVSALGFSGTFRGRRQDVGTYYDPTNVVTNEGGGFDFEAGAIAPVTFPASGVLKITVDGSWPSNEGLVASGNIKYDGSDNLLEFKKEENGSAFDQSVYFKGVGEMTPESTADLALLGGEDASMVRFSASSDEKNISLSNVLKKRSDGSELTIVSDDINLENPTYQANYFKPYTVAEYVGFEPTYSSVGINAIGPTMNSNLVSIDRQNSSSVKNSARASNHISVIETVGTDGMRYTFGIPAYEVKNSQVSFCATTLAEITPNSGLTKYQNDNNVIGSSNALGVSKYFDRTDVPAYAHSFLITKMVSSDYVDRGVPGLSMEDIGNYYKFNHTRLYDDTNPYRWKFPMGINTAILNKNKLGTIQDDIANYMYGEKEIWYTHSIESKNMIAEIILQNRADGYGVKNENGERDISKALQSIQKIVIYNRSERLGANGANAIPLQTIEFEYDYSLCKNHPSNILTPLDTPPITTIHNSGKLTLRAIRSYSGNSKEMAIYAYKFSYGTENPNYSSFMNDAWGNYKTSSARPFDLFPYADQVEAQANQNSKAWKLTTIKNPMGGVIEVDYESDTYATVQDNKAMKHVNVYGMTNILDFLKIQASPSFTGTSTYLGSNFNTNYANATNLQASLTGWSTSGNFNDFTRYFVENGSGDGTYKSLYGSLRVTSVPNNVIVFKLDQELTEADYPLKDNASAKVKADYFTNVKNNGSKEVMSEIYMKLLVKVSPGVNDILPTFGKIASDQDDVFNNTLPIGDSYKAIGVLPPSNGKYQYGYVIIEPAQAADKSKKEDNPKYSIQFNSLQKSAMEFIRRNLPDILYGACAGCIADDVLDKAMIRGKDMNMEMNRNGWAQSFNPNTTVRLFVPNSIVKFGGNGRVKSITYRDNWAAISTEYNGEYKWNYFYKDRSSAGGNMSFTSGNACFEPKTIIDESPLYRWNSYFNIVKRFPDESKFTPTPIAVDLFPGAMVGYQRVEVEFSLEAVKGISVSEFHTSRQFPFTETVSEIDKSIHLTKPAALLLGKTTDKFALSQGFMIKTNDFHGKPSYSKVTKKDANGNEVVQSRTTYKYRKLGEQISMIDRESRISPETVAQEVDIHADSRKSINSFSSSSKGISLVVKLSLPTFMPVAILPVPIISSMERTEEFNSYALIKHINQSAVVESIQTEYLGSVNTAKNEIYDKYSGNVILSSLQDEYGDNLYSFNYPSHWYYKELREKMNMENKTFVTSVTMQGTLDATNVGDFLTPGDEVQLMNVSNPPPTCTVAQHTGGNMYLMNANGSGYTLSVAMPNLQVKISKSNRDNRLNETMQSVVTKKYPLTANSSSFVTGYPTTEIIEANALSYKDKNYVQCIKEGRPESFSNEVLVGSLLNPYKIGIRGDLVLDVQYAWQGERVNAASAYKTRFDGTYAGTFTPIYYFDVPTNNWLKINTNGHANWREMGDVTRYNQFGRPIESRDQLNVSSSVLYGYNSSYELVPAAQAVNAREQEIAFDGFEDYNYFNDGLLVNTESHFDFKKALSTSIPYPVALNNTIRHSGLNSLGIRNNARASVTKLIATSTCIASEQMDPKSNCFKVSDCNCTKPFEPTPGEYIVGVWVKNTDPLVTSNGSVAIEIVGGTNVTLLPNGPVVDGWQRLEHQFTIAPGATSISISLQNFNSTGAVAYFDDFRIHPLLAGMTTTVYDPKTLLPLATHDGYNFTTFYNYDENLNLVRMKVETVEGIKTVSESEMGGFEDPKK